MAKIVDVRSPRTIVNSKNISLDSEADTDTSVALIVIFLWNGNSHFL